MYYVTCYVSLYDYMWVAHTHVHVQTREVYSVRQVVLEWEDLKVMWAMQFPPRATAPRAAHRDATAELQIAVGPGHAKRGATCTYLKACSPPCISYYSNSFKATALEQHREQSI